MSAFMLLLTQKNIFFCMNFIKNQSVNHIHPSPLLSFQQALLPTFTGIVQ